MNYHAKQIRYFYSSYFPIRVLDQLHWKLRPLWCKATSIILGQFVSQMTRACLVRAAIEDKMI
jgi:hypothetical protein